MRADRFGMTGVFLEECDYETDPLTKKPKIDPAISGCSIDCKVMEGFSCTGGDWNEKDSCVRVDNFEVKIQAVMTKFNDSVVHTNNFK